MERQMVEEINFYRNLVGKVLSFSFFLRKIKKVVKNSKSFPEESDIMYVDRILE